MTWLVGRVHTRAETDLAYRLSQEGYKAYTPQAGARAAFPGYLFVDDAHALPVLAMGRRLKGYFDYLESDGKWATVPDEIIDSIRFDEAHGLFDEPRLTIERDGYRIGDWCKVTGVHKNGRYHPMFGMEGMIQEISKRSRETIWLIGGDFSKKTGLWKRHLNKIRKPARFSTAHELRR